MLELNALQHAHQKMASQRQRTGLNFIELAYENLARSELSGFEDKEALKAAADFFIKALKYTPGVEGFVGLSYVYLLLGNHPMATRYLALAQDKAPHNPDVLALFAYAQNPVDLDGEDPDAAFDTLEALLFAQEKQLRHWPLPHLDQAMQNAKAHAERTLILTENLTLIHDKLNQLAEDDADLLHRVRHLEDTHQKFLDCQEKITRIQELSSQIQQGMRETTALIKSANASSLVIIDAPLEELLERNSALGHTLDDLTQRGFPVTHLENSFGLWLLLLDQLQDLAED